MLDSDLLKEKVLQYIKEAVKNYSNENKIYGEWKVRIEYSRDEKFGDYSSSISMENKKLHLKNPMEVAASLVSFIDIVNKKNPYFREITTTTPGFINFRIHEKVLKEYIIKYIVTHSFAKEKQIRYINLEFVSANPTGPLNIVSARAASFGDALANLLETLGHKVDREFYVNDYGNQVQLLGVAVLLRLKELEGNQLSFQEEEDGRTLEELIYTFTLPKESYRGEYIIQIAEKVKENKELMGEVEEAWNSKNILGIIDKLAVFAVEYNLSSQKKDLEDFGVKFNRFFSERSLHEEGKVFQALEALERTGKVYESNGKKIFQSTLYGDDKDRVLVREDGRPTYLLADIAYHKNKMDRNYNEIIDIWGPDHHGYIARLKGAMEALGYPKNSFHIMICQQVNLIENGTKVKMSKRLGNFQRMRDLIQYLGRSARDVGRYFFITRTAEAILDFDLDLAKDESEKNPVFYIQYAHARVCSIFREVNPEVDYDYDNDFVWTQERRNLLFWISKFPEEVYDAAIQREPHRLTTYLYFLAKIFTEFYGKKENHLKSSDEKTKKQLAFLCKGTQIVLSNGLSLLGISAPEKMEK